ncbi:phage tail protein [Massilia sp. PAMC28688]|uniref:phage tail protein n=1 Tax=Massilia sp. PAMC28688 TaxID=2861283 RepID=UPI001C63B093|nr:phage tail protein [Massilia sp. PAMC28688]QYF95533.1 phage tail protein [Massilia sp. PAMC28688]
MDLIGQLRDSVDGATVIALPAVPALPIGLQEHDLSLRGFNVSIGAGCALASLFALLEGAGITLAGEAVPVTVLRLKICLTNSNGTVAKLLFDGLPDAAGVLHGTVNGQGVFARAAFARQLRQWVSLQKELAAA